MKKLFIYFFAFVIICFILPALLTKRDMGTFSNEEEQNQTELGEGEMQNQVQNETGEQQNSINEQQAAENNLIIKLLHKETGQVEEVNLENYLCNVVSAEMPADYELEALKAQAIVARTYTIYKIKNKKHDNADICDDSTCCQAWISKEDRLARWEESKRESNWQKIEQCVNETKGKIVTYQNEPINAFFHSNSGGKTEIPINVWGGSGMPYLQVVETSGEENYSQYSSEAVFSKDELKNKMIEKYSDFEIDFNDQSCICILEYTESGRVKTIKIGNKNLSGVEARTIFGLRSANFEVVIEGDNIKFTVKGYGHGIGMSQTGADSLANNRK